MPPPDPTILEDLLFPLDKGGATLIAAAIAAIVSIVSLIVTVLSSRAQARLASRLTDSTNVNKEAREYRLKQLTQFYDPIYTLLSANGAIFERVGPTSAARKSGQFNDEETAEVWGRLSNEVVVPNNQKICEIIQGNLHFMSATDNESLYLEFLTHAHAYKIFKEKAYEAYRLFGFPAKFFENVRVVRVNLISDLENLYK